MSDDFDRVVDRRLTENNKWRKFPADVLPLWVADIDFPSPEPVIRALRQRVEHGFFGYGVEQPEFYEVIIDRLQKRYGWRVAPEAIVHLPGVIPSFNLACRAFAAPGQGILVQTPVYPPILRAPDNCGLTREEAEMARQPNGRAHRGLGRVHGGHPGADAPFLALQSAQPGGARLRPRRAPAHGRDLPRARARHLRRRDPLRARLPGHAHVPIASLDPEIERQTITLMAPSKTFNDGAAFGRPGGGFVRLNFGYPRSILADALDRMRRALVESS